MCKSRRNAAQLPPLSTTNVQPVEPDSKDITKVSKKQENSHAYKKVFQFWKSDYF